jgi:hypothetical protein
MNIREFINNVLINEIGEIKSKHPFLAFNLICSGIEFLGRCLKYTEIEKLDDRKSSAHFKKAIKETFPSSYKNLDSILWEDLRNGMTHIFSPKSKIGLSELRHNKSTKIEPQNHPYKQNNDKYILIIEYFYNDFVEACKKVIREKNSLMNQNFLTTPDNN